MNWNNVKTNQTGTIIVNGYATPDLSEEMLERWADDLSYISIYSYGFSMDGQLVPIPDGRLIEEADKMGVGPLMVLTPFNESGVYQYELLRELFTNPDMRDKLINNVVQTVMEKNYYGVVFNFGYIAPEDKEQFVITISKTAARLNRRAKIVIVSLIPWLDDEGIDYRSLGMAANAVELRTFSQDELCESPGQYASIERLRAMLDDITAMIRPGKILLGLLNSGADSDRLRARLELVNEYGLGGVSIWTIMNPFPAGVELIKELFTVYKI